MPDAHVPISGLYAALQGLVTLVLAFPIGPMRVRSKISLGDGGNSALTVAIRRHANWAEHVPFALLLLAMLELNGASPTLLHSLGAALLVARIAHPFGLRADTVQSVWRAIGAAGTGIVSAIAAIVLLLDFVRG